MDLNDLLANLNPKAPLEATLRSHWLCIDGIQPTIPENPPPVAKSIQKVFQGFLISFRVKILEILSQSEKNLLMFLPDFTLI